MVSGRGTMKIYQVYYQPAPRKRFRTTMVTDERSKAEAVATSVRRGFFVTWEEGAIIRWALPPETPKEMK
jgi:hypothetical protein